MQIPQKCLNCQQLGHKEIIVLISNQAMGVPPSENVHKQEIKIPPDILFLNETRLHKTQLHKTNSNYEVKIRKMP